MPSTLSPVVLIAIWTFTLAVSGFPINEKGNDDIVCFPSKSRADLAICFDMNASVFQFVRKESNKRPDQLIDAGDILLSKLKSKVRSMEKRGFDSINFPGTIDGFKDYSSNKKERLL
nr:oocyte maturation-, sperm motility-, and spawning-inducing peptide [Atrina pectinata]